MPYILIYLATRHHNANTTPYSPPDLISALIFIGIIASLLLFLIFCVGVKND